jgi:hypothetical protein
MRKLVVVAAFAGSLLLATSAFAVAPRARATFLGSTSEKAINGYRGTVSFKVASSGRQLSKFTFETLGCFGHGRFPAGVDPYAETPWVVPTIVAAKNGSFTLTKVKATSTNAMGAAIIATITVSFKSASAATGKIVYTMKQDGATCGPATIRFNAIA